MEEVQKYCDKIVYLKDGELLYAGALDKFFEQQESKDLSEIYLRISGGEDDGDVD
jgi:ABC-2 type transport system ATP-binding protein